MKNFLFIIVSITIISSLSSCKKEDEKEFDRAAMLTNMASAVIKPAYNSMASELADLDAAAVTFSSTTNNANLIALKTEFVEAYMSFQQCKMLNFGPMMDYAVKGAMNTYPTDTAQIQTNVSAGTYNLGTFDNADAIGFPALDYLLYAQSETETVNLYTAQPNYLTYITDLTSKMKSEFDLVVNGWDGYESDFIASDGNDASSSTSLLFNEFTKDIELIKNAKIGIPAGQQTGGMTLPNYVEGYYSGISLSLAANNIAALKNVFNGISGSGFDDYIRDVEGEEITTSLADNINSQFDLCLQKVQAISNPLSNAVDTDPTAVNNTWLELKKLVTYCKTDMSSTLGLLITYQDNDGD